MYPRVERDIMKVYFEDGLMYEAPEECGDFKLDAKYGVSYCLNMLQWTKDTYPDQSIYTNSHLALSSEYCWDDVNDVCNAYVRRDGKWVNLQDTTSIKLDKGLNIPKLYLAGEFGRKEIFDNRIPRMV